MWPYKFWLTSYLAVQRKESSKNLRLPVVTDGKNKTLLIRSEREWMEKGGECSIVVNSEKLHLKAQTEAQKSQHKLTGSTGAQSLKVVCGGKIRNFWVNQADFTVPPSLFSSVLISVFMPVNWSQYWQPHRNVRKTDEGENTYYNICISYSPDGGFSSLLPMPRLESTDLQGAQSWSRATPLSRPTEMQVSHLRPCSTWWGVLVAAMWSQGMSLRFLWASIRLVTKWDCNNSQSHVIVRNIKKKTKSNLFIC